MFCVFEEEIQVEEDQSYYTYGIEAQDGTERVGNLSVVRDKVERLAQRMNAMQVSPVHLQDIAEDWLAGNFDEDEEQ